MAGAGGAGVGELGPLLEELGVLLAQDPGAQLQLVFSKGSLHVPSLFIMPEALQAKACTVPEHLCLDFLPALAPDLTPACSPVPTYWFGSTACVALLSVLQVRPELGMRLWPVTLKGNGA